MRHSPWMGALVLFAGLGMVVTGPARSDKGPNPPVALVIHGGAGVLTDAEMKAILREDGKPLERFHFEQALAEALEAGYRKLKSDSRTAALDAVETAIRSLEDCELFNAGHGAALNEDGQAELDAALMEGATAGVVERPGKKDGRKRAGAITGVHHVKNPISLARAILEQPDQGQVLLAGEGAERFAFSDPVQKRYPGQIVPVSNVYFWTGRRLADIRKAIARNPEGKIQKQGDAEKQSRRPGQQFGTVGAVARQQKNLVAGTSTGGLTNKVRGRVGDTPLIGAGTYADDRACGVSCTGTGELFIRHAVAHDVVARILYGKESLAAATQAAIDQLPDEEDGVGGLIALGATGEASFAMSRQSVGMYRGYVTQTGDIFVALYRQEPFLAMVKTPQGWKRKDVSAGRN